MYAQALSKAVRALHWWLPCVPSKQTTTRCGGWCHHRPQTTLCVVTSKRRRASMVLTGSTEQPALACCVPGPSCCRTASPQPVSTARRRWSNGLNAAKGSRQTGRVPSEDAVAPEAKSPGPAIMGGCHRGDGLPPWHAVPPGACGALSIRGRGVQAPGVHGRGVEGVAPRGRPPSMAGGLGLLPTPAVPGPILASTLCGSHGTVAVQGNLTV
jgi:hypothetical protein